TINVSSSSMLIGLAVTSHYDGTVCIANFDNVTITGTGGGGGGSVPNAPTNLKVSGVSSNSITLTWADNAINETRYRIERSQDGATFTIVAALPADSTSYTDPGLSPSTHYWYRVTAVNVAGDSPPSNVADATTTGSGGGTSGWRDQDIGTVSASGSFSQSGGTLTVNASGSDIWGNADELNYAYQNGTND